MFTILRRTIVNRTYGAHKNLCISVYSSTIFGLIYAQSGGQAFCFTCSCARPLFLCQTRMTMRPALSSASLIRRTFAASFAFMVLRERAHSSFEPSSVLVGLVRCGRTEVVLCYHGCTIEREYVFFLLWMGSPWLHTLEVTLCFHGYAGA